MHISDRNKLCFGNASALCGSSAGASVLAELNSPSKKDTFAMSVGQMSIFSNELSGLKRTFKINFYCSLIIFLSKIGFTSLKIRSASLDFKKGFMLA